MTPEQAHAEKLIYESGLRLGEAHRELSELRAEIERLRAALSIGIEALEWYEQQQVSEFDLGQKASLILKTALEPKP